MRAMVFALFTVLALCAAVPGAPALAADEAATCQDVYQIYQACYDGGKQSDLETCQYLVQGMSSQLLGSEGVGSFSAALSVAMCKRGCEDGANKQSPMAMAAFRKEFCGAGLK